MLILGIGSRKSGIGIGTVSGTLDWFISEIVRVTIVRLYHTPVHRWDVETGQRGWFAMAVRMSPHPSDHSPINIGNWY